METSNYPDINYVFTADNGKHNSYVPVLKNILTFSTQQLQHHEAF